MIERRKNRSEIPQEAVALYLAAATEGSGVRAVALAGAEGALLGGAGREASLDLLAALGAGCAERAERPGGYGAFDGIVHAVFGDEDFYASRLPVGDEILYLASIGARVPHQKAIATGLGRILAPESASSDAG